MVQLFTARQPSIPVDIVEREWRDSELARTDILVLLPDHPDKPALLEYRKALRDFPAHADFPNAARPAWVPTSAVPEEPAVAAVETPDFDAMTKSQIDAWADTQGINVDGRLSKADMIKFVNAELAKK